MAKGRQGRKRTSTSTLVMSMLLMLTIVLLLLLALGILSLPVGSDEASSAHDLSSFGRKVLERYARFSIRRFCRLFLEFNPDFCGGVEKLKRSWHGREKEPMG